MICTQHAFYKAWAGMKALLWRPIIPFMLLYAADPSINKALWEESCTGYWRILQHVTMSIILILKHDPLNTFWNARVLCNSYRSGSFIGDLPNSMHNLVALPSSLQPGWTCFSQKWGLSPTRPRIPPTYMKHYHIIHHHARWHSGPCWGKGLYNEN